MGELTRKGEFRPITADDLAVQQQRAQDMQSMQEVPVLQQSGSPHEYLYFAMFDGTGQDADDPKQELTNVGVLKEQIYQLSKDAELRLGGHYVRGVGTQDNPLVRVADKALAFSWDEKIEQSYLDLANQAKEWKEQDPEAQVRVAGVGYSRGAVLSAGLARLIDQYGIADPEDLNFGRDAQGNITVESNRPRLMEPGSVAQALALYDPVGTSFPESFDSRTPPSVISATTLTARDEDRRDFAHQAILDPGLSDDRRFANLLVPGGHSNAGGGNRDPGIEAMAFNTMADYLNALRDKPIIRYRALPAELSQYTVFQARGVSAIRGMDQDELRDFRVELANCKIVDPCRDGEPIDQALAGQFRYRTLKPTAPLPELPGLQPGRANQTAEPRPLLPTDPAHPDHALFRKVDAGVSKLDQQAGKQRDESSERLGAAAFAMAKRNGFTAQDDLQLAFNKPYVQLAGGEMLHLYRHGGHASPDPAANRVHMPTADALSMSVSERFRQVGDIEQAQQANRQESLQQAHSREQAAQATAVHVMR
jgi:hypothetical protein